ncbi:MAG: hypothetical protein GWN01_15910 [Nitrosopumilaceae archaeon]|nr:hypothetical protein [Nitrosopumilaceae archaeon]NIU02323.1 hypothetical protein [Nitrosopumilaceae archaeon]NIU88778.1 hypothetical protein [Nitrosopumilaceae archaeon]NIV66905.1 hypothetical protein [Nitrosopumilaceae archaeon]NIX62924.1 hypothetical protein [Nitrosopumilaceae archaeon]
MLLHFIFVVREEDLTRRKQEFEYVKQMGEFYRVWIKKKFSKDFEIQCDQMITKRRSIFQKLDTHTLVRDHQERGNEIYHFYLCHFKPIWTDCTCEGYHAENFGMVWWQEPKDQNDALFLAEKNCTTVSHEICHEMLRQKGHKKFIEDIHDVWVKHFYDNLPFEQYNEKFEETNEKPRFLTIDASKFNINE